MRKVYWRPPAISRLELLLIGLVAISGLTAVEFLPVTRRQPFYAEKLAAARCAREAMAAIKEERTRRGATFAAESDPAESGLIGTLLSPVTTNTGHLPAKQTTVNPNFAALVVHFLKRGGVEEGDVVAVGFSGSFPALNLCTLAALKVLKLNPVIISSASASQWGANDPDLLWIDMERVLKDGGVFTFRSLAASRGGVGDLGLGLGRPGLALLDQAIQRNGLRMIKPKNVEDSLNMRMQIFKEAAGERPIRAYINVGGGTISVGTDVGKKLFRPGLNRSMPRGAANIDAVTTRFAREGVPVIHLSRTDELATRYGLPLAPEVLPPVGAGKVFETTEYNLVLAASVLAAIIILLVLFVHGGFGYRVLSSFRRDAKSQHPEQFV